MKVSDRVDLVRMYKICVAAAGLAKTPKIFNKNVGTPAGMQKMHLGEWMPDNRLEKSCVTLLAPSQNKIVISISYVIASVPIWEPHLV